MQILPVRAKSTKCDKKTIANDFTRHQSWLQEVSPFFISFLHFFLLRWEEKGGRSMLEGEIRVRNRDKVGFWFVLCPSLAFVQSILGMKCSSCCFFGSSFNRRKFPHFWIEQKRGGWSLRSDWQLLRVVFGGICWSGSQPAQYGQWMVLSSSCVESASIIPQTAAVLWSQRCCKVNSTIKFSNPERSSCTLNWRGLEPLGSLLWQDCLIPNRPAMQMEIRNH